MFVMKAIPLSATSVALRLLSCFLIPSSHSKGSLRLHVHTNSPDLFMIVAVGCLGLI